MKLIEKYSFLIVVLLQAQIASAQSAHQLHREADRQYNRSEYKDAENNYREELKQKPDDASLRYNAGNTLYRQDKYEEAETLYKQAAEAAQDPGKRADALHNLGNTRLLQRKYQEAEQAYENSLRLRPGDPETKVNLQIAKKKRKQEDEKQKQGQQPQPNQNQNQNQQQQQQDPNQQQQNPEGQNQDQPQNQNQNQQQPQTPDGRLTPEQVRRLLETAVGPEDRRNAKKYREQDPGKHVPGVKKDW